MTSSSTPNPAPSPLSAGSPEARQGRYAITPWSLQRLYRPFIWASLLVAIIYGFGTGAGMMLAPAFGIDRGLWWIVHGQAHGVAQIFGWAGLFMIGVSFHVVPRFRNGPMDFPWPQRAVLTLVLAGVTLRFFGQSLHRRWFSPDLLEASGVLLLAGMLIYAVVIGRALIRGQNRRTQTEAWLWSAIVWAVIAAALHARIVFRMADTDAAAAPGLWNFAMIDAGLIGFVVIFILGVSTRAIVGFLRLKPMHRWLSWIALALLNVGTGWYVLARYQEASDNWTAPGLILQAAGLIAFVVALRLFEPAMRKSGYIEGTYTRYEWFIRAAFGWLLVAAGLSVLDAIGMLTGNPILSAQLAAPIIHVFTLGFVTMIIIGVGIRMLTLFEGTEAPMHWLMDVAFVALNVGVALRLLFGFGSLPGADQFQGLSGTLGLIAIISFAIVLRRSFSPEQRAAYARRAAAAGLQRFARLEVGGARPGKRPAGGPPAGSGDR
ncbi:MAG: NnrS family protein [Chloroflexi bacterium]|nr:NnrS family protein [Chloroflexota bacterium]